MKIPLKYNLRSLWVRRVGTLMSAIGIGLTVAIFIVMLALANGLVSSMVQTGRDSQMIVLRKGAVNEINSYFNRDLYQTVRFLEPIARDEAGEPLASPESIVIVNLPRRSGEKTNVVLRGLSKMGFRLRPEIRIVEGRMIRSGLRELLVSRSMSSRLAGLDLGDRVEISSAQWTVVGIFDAGGTAFDSEILAPYEDVSQEWRRPLYSSILVRTRSKSDMEALATAVSEDDRIGLQAVPQKDYYRDQSDAAGPVMALGFVVSVLMGVGAFFAAMNMMFGTVLSRVKEIATLRALGFRRSSILSSFMVEAVLLTLLGGLLGCLMALPIHGLATGTANLSRNAFPSELVFQFSITPLILCLGMAFAVMVGLLGGFLPSLRAAKVRLIEALRD